MARRLLLRATAVSLAAAVVIGALALLLGPVTSWAGGPTVSSLEGKEKADAINGVRQTLLQSAAGTAALSILAFTGLTFLLNRRGQVTDRYTKAITQLASDKMDERIGGIYALEHIMVESKRDHETVVQVLAAFIREHAPATPQPSLNDVNTSRWLHPPTGTPDRQPTSRQEPPTDIQTALTVLGRRPPKREETRPLDLRRTNLAGADLREAHLDGANLSMAHLDGAKLYRAHLKHANLSMAHLELAYLFQAHLEHAYLFQAHLKHANLSMAHLKHANLSMAHLKHANLRGTDLTEAVGLRPSQIKVAITDAETRLPSNLDWV